MNIRRVSPPLTTLLAGATAALCLLAASSEALAYRQTKTCLIEAERDPGAYTAIPNCRLGQVGWPVHWPKRTIKYRVNRKGHDSILPGVDGELHPDVLATVRGSLEQWSSQSCSDFTFEYDGLTDLDRYSSDDGVNVITWVDEGWAESSATIALTTTTMTQRGILVDADMEFNVRAHRFSISTPPAPGAMDLANTATHEAGHMLGLDEAPDVEATMYYQAQPEETRKRDLYPDDVAGLCAIYGVGVPNATYDDMIDPDMGGGGDGSDEGCCAVLSNDSPAERGQGAALAALALGLIGWRRRRAAATGT